MDKIMINGVTREMTPEEKEALERLQQAAPPPMPSAEEQIAQLRADMQAAADMLAALL